MDVHILGVKFQGAIEFGHGLVDIPLLVETVSADVQAYRVKIYNGTRPEKGGMVQRFTGVVEDAFLLIIHQGKQGAPDGKRGRLQSVQLFFQRRAAVFFPGTVRE